VKFFSTLICVAACWVSLSAQQADSIYIKICDSLYQSSNAFYNQKDYTKAIEQRTKAMPLLTQLKDWDAMVSQYNYIYVIANRAKDMMTSEMALDSAYHYCTTKLDRNFDSYFYTIANLGFEEWKATNFSAAIAYLNDAIHGLDSLETPLPYYSNNVLTLLDAYRQKGENQKAVEIASYYRAKAKEVKAEKLELDFLMQKAICLRQNADYALAVQTIQEVLLQNQSTTDQNRKHKNRYNYTRALANTYREAGQLNKALESINNSSDHWQKLNKNLHYLSYSDKGDILLELENYDAALTEFENALFKYSERKVKKPKILSSLLSKKGYTYFKLNRLDSAAVYLNKSAEFLDISLEKKFDSFSDYLTTKSFNLNSVKILSRIAEFEMHSFLMDKDEDAKQRAIIRFAQAFKGTKYLYKELHSNADKYQLNSNIQKYLTQYLNLLVEVHKTTNDTETLKKIFELIEDNKSLVLKEDLHKKKILLESDIDEKTRSKEKQFRESINALNKKIYNHKSQGKEDALVQNWNQELLEVKIKFERFQDKLEKEHLEYYRSAYAINPLRLEDLQTVLKNDESYLNYFIAEQAILCLWISHDQIGVFEIQDHENFLKNLESYTHAVRRKPESHYTKNDLSKFKTTGFSLFNDLIDPNLKSKDNYIISPHSSLYYLPFETLLTEKAASSNSFKTLPYLIKTANIEYAFSSELFLQGRNKTTPSKKLRVVSYAPFTQSNSNESKASNTLRTALGNLECSTIELDAISTDFNNTTLLNNEATVSAFKKNIDFDIIHLATHGSLDDQNSDFNKLYFSDGYLAVQDLSDIDFDASLVVLSACNTAMGNIQSGEGVIHLGRGFRKAGVHSIIHSLWALNDCTTADLIGHFYSRLQDSDIATALADSKKQYLNTADKLSSHPYYWAGLIFSGNSSTFTNSNSAFKFSNSTLLFSLFASLLIFLFINRHKKTSKTGYLL